jgi:XTP/dITP diphosphohydrolase
MKQKVSTMESATPLQLLVGTNNTHKAGEIATMLRDSHRPIRVVTPRDLGLTEEPEENGATFEANALIKARYYASQSGLPCLADDSGLVVDALDGRPGVYSSRYAPSDPERIARLLRELEGVPESRRAARFVCAAAFVVPSTPDQPSSLETVRVGTCEGRIAFDARGENGFGYDPVFFLPDVEKTMAELTPAEKNARSHRGRALEAILPCLLETLNA